MYQRLLMVTICLLISTMQLQAAGVITTSKFNFKSLYVFGDSLSDNGTSDGYGFNRYANGDVWGDYLNRQLGISNYVNFAHGGALSGQGNINSLDWSGLQWQLDAFEQKDQYPVDSHTLSTIWIGVNDFFAASQRRQDSTSLRRQQEIQQVLDHVVQGVQRLFQKGVKHLVVMNVPDVSLMPGFQGSYSSNLAYISNLSQSFNQQLKPLLEQIQQSYPGHHLYFIDTFQITQNIALEFENIDTPWNGSYLRPYPDSYMWWDEWHPMTEVHRKIAQKVLVSMEKLKVGEIEH